ncbi:MAG TPA: hypothetical protein VGM77_09080 [Gemmatimonadales bacterium]|jgi:hypothetical protein
MIIHREWLASSPFRLALIVAVGAAAACGWIGVRALHPAPVAPVMPGLVASVGALDDAPAPPPLDIEAATERDLFAENRNAPAERYRLPSELAKNAVVVSAPMSVTVPVVLGTAIGADGTSFATCQFGSARLVMAHVGDHVGGYLVKAIERGHVTFTGPDGKLLDILAPKAGS